MLISIAIPAFNEEKLLGETLAVVVFEPENQISRSRNASGNATKGDWIIFFDADSTPSKGLFGDTADLMESDNTLGGGAVIRMEVMPW